MAYLLDSDIFIQAKNRHYGFDFCPAFWDWLIEKNALGLVLSIEKVEDELRAGHDELSNWAIQRGPGFFLRPDSAILPCFSQVSAWVSSQGFEPAAVSTFLNAADFFLIAHALCHGDTVVTHEIPSNGRKRIKIPTACIGLNVRFLNPFQMLRIENARFVLPPQSVGTP